MNLRRRKTPDRMPLLVGLAVVVFSAIYFLSDLIELAQGGFSTAQLALTLGAEAAIPIFVVGLYVLQRPQMGRLGLAGTIGYAYSFVFFTGTVVLALATGTKNWDALVGQMGVWMTIHGVVMVLAGTALGLAVVRARVLPRWTGVTLIAGVVLIAASSALPDLAQTVSAGVRDLAFVGMGASLLNGRLRRTVTTPVRLEPPAVQSERYAS
ncbi:MAG: hypothetical protein QOF16_409 [Actinomycetota bacterium]|nr:hypothetical protein [Actinomycetota bacterium]MEA2486755.1 hypothetical protein [Actinomycetota bacterium]